MESFVHPKNNISIEGVKLGPGAVLRDSDLYPSLEGDGEWKSCTTPGLVLGALCSTLWVRPVALSENARTLLEYLELSAFCVARWPRWRVIPSLQHKNNGRVDLAIQHTESIAELLEYGLLTPYAEDADVYHMSKQGRRAVQHLK